MELDVDALRGSYVLAANRRPDFARRFFAILFARHPGARRLFDLPGTSPRVRDRSFRLALEAVLEHLEDASWLDDRLEMLGADNLVRGVTRDVYAWCGECLVATLADAAASGWTPHVGRAWADAIAVVTARMIEGAAEADTLVDYAVTPPPP
jgi:hemoglobin-like flavoprotein